MTHKIILLLSILLLPLVAKAAAVEINGIYYLLDDEKLVAEVTSGANQYAGHVEIPSAVTYNEVSYRVTGIRTYAFSRSSTLTSVTIPGSVKTIGNYAFQYSELSSITLDDGVESIGESVFQYCSNLTSVTIPNSVRSMGSSIFYSCGSLKNVTIGNAVASIGKKSFFKCKLLTDVIIGSSVESIGDNAFEECSSLASITIPGSVVGIGNDVFNGCSGLTDIILPNSVTTLGYRIFEGCTSLQSATLPNGITKIGIYTFSGCSSLASITIPSKVTSIAGFAFNGCTGLKEVRVYAETPPTVSSNNFSNYTIPLYVPEASMDAYKATDPWSSFTDVRALDDVTQERCAEPTISYANGKLMLTSETEGAVCVAIITADDAKTYQGNEVELTTIYRVSAYAKKEGYKNSEIVTKDINVSSGGGGAGCDVDGNGSVTITDAVKVVNKILEQEKVKR